MPSQKQTRRVAGAQASFSNISACIQLADALEPTFGFAGRDLMLVDEVGDVMLDNSGASLLNALDIQHPAAVLLSRIATSQHRGYGDGTTSVVLLAAEMLRRAHTLLRDGMHSAVLLHSLRQFLPIAQHAIHEISAPASSFNNTKIRLTRTSLASRVSPTDREHLAKLSARAAELSSYTGTNSLHTVVSSGRVRQSQVIPGIMLPVQPDTFPVHAPLSLVSPRIIITRIDLDRPRSRIHSATVRVSSHFEGARLSNREQSILTERCQSILDIYHPDIILNHGTVSPIAAQYFADRDVLCIGGIGFSDQSRISAACGSDIITAIRTSDSSPVSVKNTTDRERHGVMQSDGCDKAETASVVRCGSDAYLRISPCPYPYACTVWIRGPTPAVRERCLRSIKDAVLTLSIVYGDNNASKEETNKDEYHGHNVVIGGGASFTAAANSIRNVNNVNLEAKDGFRNIAVREMLSGALERLPIILRSNAGDTLTEGKDTDHGDPLEPESTIQGVLRGAVEATETILRIDGNLFVEPRPDPREEGYI